MRHNITLLLIFYVLVGVSLADKDLCPTVEEFERNNEEFMGKDYKEFKANIKGDFIKYLARTSKIIASGTFGEVYELFNNKDTVIKMLKFRDEGEKKEYLREVMMLRLVCGHSEDEYDRITECRSHAIAGFKGCILDDNAIYLFQERMSFDLSGRDTKKAYKALPPLERVRIMLDVIDRLIELHKEKVVHSDIKPANIMLKHSNFTEIRVVDLGVANKEGEKMVGGTHGYLPLEAYKPENGKTLLSFKYDIFALGMTFAELEGDFSNEHGIIKGRCFEKPYMYEICKEALAEGLDHAFKADKKLDSLLPVMQIAVSFDKEFRFSDMKDFADALVKKLQNLPGYKDYLKKYFNKLDNQNSNDDFVSYWRSKLGPKFAPPKKLKKVVQQVLQQQQQQNNSSGGVMNWLAKKFSCSGSKKKKQNLLQTVDQFNDNNVNGQTNSKLLI